MVDESQKRAPGAVVVLASVWLVSAAVALLSALGLIVVFGVVSNFTPGGTDSLPLPPPAARPVYWAFQHYLLTGTVQGALALLGIYCGIQFLRLERWARTVLEACGWAAIALSVALGIWRSQFWFAASTHAVAVPAIRLIAGFLIAASYAVFPAVFVWLLRSRWVAPAFASGARQSSSG